MMTMIRSNLNQLVSRAEDPQRMLDMVIVDMQTQLVQAKKQVAVVIADEKRLARQCTTARNEAQRWESKAILAIKAGDDNLARAALLRKSEHDELATMYTDQWEGQKKSCDALRSALVGLSQKIDEAHRTRRVLIARQRRAEAQRTINETLSNLGAHSHTAVIERMEQRVVQIEAEAEAVYELGEGVEPSLEAQFRALEAASVDDALSELKQKMALQSAEAERLALPSSPS